MSYMKIFSLSIIILSIMILSIPSLEKISHAENENISIMMIKANDTDDVEIQNIQVQPSEPKVGDTLKITATLVNNSPIPIFVETSDDCEGPFVVIFDNHVKVNHSPLSCAYRLFTKMLNQNEKITKTSPGPSLVYKAVIAGTVNSSVTFSYFIMNQTGSNMSHIDKTISKSFLLTILDNKTDTSTITHKEHSVSNLIKSSLMQFKSGIATKDVTCKEGLQLVLKSENNHPACVKPNTVKILIERGWARTIQ